MRGRAGARERRPPEPRSNARGCGSAEARPTWSRALSGSRAIAWSKSRRALSSSTPMRALPYQKSASGSSGASSRALRWAAISSFGGTPRAPPHSGRIEPGRRPVSRPRRSAGTSRRIPFRRGPCTTRNTPAPERRPCRPGASGTPRRPCPCADRGGRPPCGLWRYPPQRRRSRSAFAGVPRTVVGAHVPSGRGPTPKRSSPARAGSRRTSAPLRPNR